jgi:hypothetical protein
MCIAHRHQLLPQLTGYAVVTGVRRFRDEQGDMEGRDRDGLKERRTLRKHGGGGFLQRDGVLQFLVHNAVHKQLHELPSVKLLAIAVCAAARLVRCEEPLRIGDEQGLRHEALMLDETRLANHGGHRVDAAIRFGVLFPEGRVLSLDACGCVGGCFSCFGFRFGCLDGLASGGALCLLDVLVDGAWCVLHGIECG